MGTWELTSIQTILKLCKKRKIKVSGSLEYAQRWPSCGCPCPCVLCSCVMFMCCCSSPGFPGRWVSFPPGGHGRGPLPGPRPNSSGRPLPRSALTQRSAQAAAPQLVCDSFSIFYLGLMSYFITSSCLSYQVQQGHTVGVWWSTGTP